MANSLTGLIAYEKKIIVIYLKNLHLSYNNVLFFFLQVPEYLIFKVISSSKY